MNIRGLTVGIPVSNLEESSKWYRLLLGEREELQPVKGVTELLLANGSWLQLMEMKDFSPSANILRLDVEDIDAAHKNVGAMNAKPGEIVRIPELIAFFDFRDIDGNNLSIYELDTNTA